MKDVAVATAGLFSPERQRRLIDALIRRYETCEKERQTLIERHSLEREREEEELLSSRSSVTEDCRRRRRQTLGQWDSAEEQLFASYEQEMIALRKELGRTDAVFRKRFADGKASIEGKVEARRAAILEQYESKRHEPGKNSRKEFEKIKSSLAVMTDDLVWARQETVKRLDSLPSVPPDDSVGEIEPQSIKEAIDVIFDESRKLKTHVSDMQSGLAAKLVNPIYMVSGIVVSGAIWVAISVGLGLQPLVWYIIGGVVAALVIGFIAYVLLSIPLRSQTRRIYPLIKHCEESAENAATVGRAISTSNAKRMAEELVKERDSHLEAANVWRTEQHSELEKHLEQEKEQVKNDLRQKLEQLGGAFQKQLGEINSQMHDKAERVASEITGELSNTDQALHQQREQNASRRKEELRRVTDRMKIGVNSGFDRIATTAKDVDNRFPNWELLAQDPQTDEVKLDYVPLGTLNIGPPLCRSLASEPESSEVIPMFTPEEIPGQLPLALHRRLHSGLIIHASQNQISQATELVRQVLWRMLAGTAGGRTKLTLIDPIGRGQNFTSFMSLADHDPSLVGHRVWTTEQQIEARLGEIAQHAEDILQSSLRDQFQRVEDYNELAGSMAEPYRAVAAIGFPEGLTRGGYKHLMALIESGIRCGVFVLMVCDKDKPWPSDLPLPQDQRLLQFSVDESGNWVLEHQGLQELSFQPAANLPSEYRSQLVSRIGRATVQAARVEVPLESLIPESDGQGSTDDGIEIVIGSQGGHRQLALALGEGVRQHVLIAGKTGSGKSTLLHSIITSGAQHYTPDELQYYLLDFKKGVEFKAYVDSKLPHAHVIGIESEREFGRSVLERLDKELQERGEAFRTVSAQELSDYRKASGQSMPRIMLVIDEFQELFVRDDRVAADCSMLLDRLVRQGRSFGIHVILSSQSLAGAYSLPRATLGQMAVRIAMQCSESDAALILSDDNTAARLITRPGEAIYNDAGGLVEGNQPFQVAWLASDRHQELLLKIASRDREFVDKLPPPVVFQGNRPCEWTPALATAAIRDAADKSEEIQGLLGEAVEIGPPVSIALNRSAGRNVLMIPPQESRASLLVSMISGFAKSNPDLEIVYFNGTRTSEAPSIFPWMHRAGLNVREVKPRESEPEMVKLAELVKERGDEAENVHPILVVVDPLDRFRDFRHEDAFNFSLDATPGSMSGGQAMRELLKDGPPAHVYGILVCGGAEIVNRWLPRQSQHDMELRVFGRLNASDSSLLIDSPVATELSDATMLLYDEPTGKITKFRVPEQPDAFDVKAWLG